MFSVPSVPSDGSESTQRNDKPPAVWESDENSKVLL